jgi:hypothetical protein
LLIFVNTLCTHTLVFILEVNFNFSQPISVELPIPSVDIMKTSPGMSPVESIPIFEASDNTAGTFENEDNAANPPKWSWVMLNHPPSSSSGLLKKGVG